MEAAKLARADQLRRYAAREKQSSSTATRKRSIFSKDVTWSGEARLRCAVVDKDVKEMKDLLAVKDHYVITRQAINSALLVSCRYGDINTTSILLKNGAYKDYQDEDLWTPLHTAASNGNTDIVNLLIEEYGADCTLLDVDGLFALDHVDASNITLRGIIVEQMKQSGIYDEDMASIKGRLHKAMIAAVKSAINRKKDLTQFNKNGATPLHTAAAYGYMEVVKMLLDYGVPADIGDDLGLTPLHVAWKYKQWSVADYLVSKGATIIEGYSPKRYRYNNNASIISNICKIDNITKVDCIKEGECLLRYASSGEVVEDLFSHQNPSSDAPEMIYDDCIELRKEIITVTTPTPTVEHTIEDLYDCMFNIKQPIEDDYDDICIKHPSNDHVTASNSHVTSSNDHVTSNAKSSPPRPYEDFVPLSLTSQAVPTEPAADYEEVTMPHSREDGTRSPRRKAKTQITKSPDPPHNPRRKTTYRRAKLLSYNEDHVGSNNDADTGPDNIDTGSNNLEVSKKHKPVCKAKSADSAVSYRGPSSPNRRPRPPPILEGSTEWQTRLFPLQPSPIMKRDSIPTNAPPPVPPHKKTSLPETSPKKSPPLPTRRRASEETPPSNNKPHSPVSPNRLRYLNPVSTDRPQHPEPTAIRRGSDEAQQSDSQKQATPPPLPPRNNVKLQKSPPPHVPRSPSRSPPPSYDASWKSPSPTGMPHNRLNLSPSSSVESMSPPSTSKSNNAPLASPLFQIKQTREASQATLSSSIISLGDDDTPHNSQVCSLTAQGVPRHPPQASQNRQYVPVTEICHANINNIVQKIK